LDRKLTRWKVSGRREITEDLGALSVSAVGRERLLSWWLVFLELLRYPALGYV